MLNSDGRVRELVSKDRDAMLDVFTCGSYYICDIYIHHTAMIILLSLGCFDCLCSLGCFWQGHWAACECQEVFRDWKAKSLHSLGLPASQVHCPALWQTVSSTTICYQLLSAELMYELSVASYPGQVGQKKWPDIHHSLHVWCFLGGPHTTPLN